CWSTSHAASTPFAWPKGSRHPRISRNAAGSASGTARVSISAFPKRSPRPRPPESSRDRARADLAGPARRSGYTLLAHLAGRLPHLLGGSSRLLLLLGPG